MHRNSRFHINACTEGVKRIVAAERKGLIKKVDGWAKLADYQDIYLS